MRKGTTLIEVLAVITILATLSVGLTALFRTLLIEIPRAERLTAVNVTVANMLDQMRKDVDAAGSLPDAFGQSSSGEKLLLIRLPAGVICYQLDQDEVTRRWLGGGKPPADRARSAWEVPGAEIRWRLWRKAGKAYAVEVRTHLRGATQAGLQGKLANSHVYFLGSLPGHGEKT